jgi:hypothetical protein
MSLTLQTETTPEADFRTEAAALNRRIVLVASVVVAELWALTAAIEAWAEGRTAVLVWILGFQLVSFLLALSISTAPATSAARRSLVPVGSPEPATAD